MPTFLVQPGEPFKLFNADSAAAPVNSATAALPTTLAKIITWVYKFATAPSAATIKLQMSEDGTIWNDLDSGTLTTGETKTTNPTNANFIRARKDVQTGGGALTVEITAGY